MIFRAIGDQDRGTIAQWIAKDSDHNGRVTSDFWVNAPENAQTWAVEDDEGTLFYVRAENLLRLHIQFPPDQKRRLVKGIVEFSELIRRIAGRKGYAQVIFESESPALIRFLEKHGFHHSPNEYVAEAEEPNNEDTPPNPAGQRTV